MDFSGVLAASSETGRGEAGDFHFGLDLWRRP